MGTIVEKTIPEQVDEPHDVLDLIFNATDKTCTVRFVQGGLVSKRSFLVSTVLAAATTEQKTTVKTFIRQCIAYAVGVDTSAVPEDTLES